jgi:hypothetical protein
MVDPTPINGTGGDSDVDAFFRSRGMQTYGEVQKKQEELLPKYEEATRPAVESLEKARTERDKLTAAPIKPPAAPTLQSMPAAPRQQYDDPMKAFGSPAVILATLGSLFTRHPLKVAFDSAAAAIDGYHKGDKEKAELEQKNWQEATEAAINQNKTELEKYQAAWKETEHNVNERFAKMHAIAAGVKDEVMLSGLKTGNLDLIWKTLEQRQTAMDKLVQFQTQEKDRQERLKQQQEMIDIRRQQANTARQNQEQSFLSDESLKMRAQQYVVAGDEGVRRGLGGGVSGRVNLARLDDMIAQTQKEMGVDAKEQAKRIAGFIGEKQYQRTAGGYSARVEVASNEVAQMAPLALESSEKLERMGGGFVAVNEAQQAWMRGTSNLALTEFATNNFALKNAYVRAMNPTGVPRVQERAEAHAEGLFKTATSQEAYRKMVETMLREVLGSKRAVAATRSEAEVESKLIDLLSGKEGSAASDDPKTMSDDELKKRLGIK